MSVAEYEHKFTELSRYAEQLISDEASRCRRFQKGLELNIRRELTSQRISNYPELVNTARDIEKDVKEGEEIREWFKRQNLNNQQGGRSGVSVGRYSRTGSNKAQTRGTWNRDISMIEIVTV